MKDIPVVFIPGTLCDARLFFPQVEELSQNWVVSVAPPLVGGSITQYATCLAAQLPSRFSVVGHELGACIAMELVRKIPERVDRLAIMSANALADVPSDITQREHDIVAARSGPFPDCYTKSLASRLSKPGSSEQVLNVLQDMAEASNPQIYIDHIRAMQKRPDQQSTLRRYNKPVGIICGRDDPIYPVRRIEFLAQLIPDAQLYVIDRAGHYPSLENPMDCTLALSRWLKQPLVLHRTA